MTQSEYARATGLTRARVSQLVAAGMPIESKELADAWRMRNVKGAIHKEAKRAVPDPNLPVSAVAVPTVEGPYRPPEAEAPIDAAKVSDDTPQGAYERQRKIERAAYGLAARALNERRADAKHLVAVHAQAARNLAQLRLEVLAVSERERSLVSGEWVRKIITDHDGAVVTLVKAMPKQLAGRIAPHDPEHAENELSRWVQEVFLKTLHNTNPFTNERKTED
jgi:hypothetical protein